MKTSRIALVASLAVGLLAPAWAQKEKEASKANALDLPEIEYPAPRTADQRKAVAKHTEDSQILANEQDELSADVQDLIEEQTSEKVIVLLGEVERFMAEVTGKLDETKTGGKTIAAETHIIEKIFEAAKERSQQNGGTCPSSGMSMGAMLDMMQRMMGQNPGQGQKPGKGKGGETAGEGSGGDSNSPNKDLANAGAGKTEVRSIGKKAGKAGSHLPPEFQKALDAYNKDRR